MGKKICEKKQMNRKGTRKKRSGQLKREGGEGEKRERERSQKQNE
jgi:hypothetical protein